MFRDYYKDGLARSFDWDEYHIYTDRPLFAHRTLPHEVVLRYMDIAYKEVILKNPSFVLRRMMRGVRTGEFFWDAYYFVKFILSPSYNKDSAGYSYYAKERWPVHDWKAGGITFTEYQRATYGSKPRPALQELPVATKRP
jgi:hypothetical protein